MDRGGGLRRGDLGLWTGRVGRERMDWQKVYQERMDRGWWAGGVDWCGWVDWERVDPEREGPGRRRVSVGSRETGEGCSLEGTGGSVLPFHGGEVKLPKNRLMTDLVYVSVGVTFQTLPRPNRTLSVTLEVGVSLPSWCSNE